MLLWGIVECCLGVVCTCMPYLIPYRRFFRANTTNRASNERNKDSLIASRSWPGRRPSTISKGGKDKVNGTKESELGWWTVELHDIRSRCNDGSDRHVTIQRSEVAPRDGTEEFVPDNRIKVSNDLRWKSEAKTIGHVL